MVGFIRSRLLLPMAAALVALGLAGCVVEPGGGYYGGGYGGGVYRAAPVYQPGYAVYGGGYRGPVGYAAPRHGYRGGRERDVNHRGSRNEY